MVFLYMAPVKERRPRGHAGDAVIVADPGRGSVCLRIILI